MPRGEFDRSERRAQTRARLLEAAARVYARRGFDGATVDEVAADAGMTKGAVYDHFGSKDSLLMALLKEHLGAQIAEQVTLFDPSKEASERPRAGADRWMAGLEEDPDAFRLFVEAWVHAQRDEALREPIVSGMRAWRATFEDFGARDGDVPTDALRQVSTVMMAMGIGLGIVSLADPHAVQPGLLGTVLVLLLRALERDGQALESWPGRRN